MCLAAPQPSGREGLAQHNGSSPPHAIVGADRLRQAFVLEEADKGYDDRHFLC